VLTKESQNNYKENNYKEKRTMFTLYVKTYCRTYITEIRVSISNKKIIRTHNKKEFYNYKIQHHLKMHSNFYI
jgi:DNA-directed RNA polymerase subunit L